MFDRDELFRRMPELSECRGEMEKALDILITAAKQGCILTCGNGGSAADSEHIAGELTKGFLKKRPLPSEEKAAWAAFGEDGRKAADTLQQGIFAIPLTGQISSLSAFSNDCDPSLAYAQLAWNYARRDSALIAISTSGGAKNVRYAAMAVKARCGKVISLTGRCESPLSELADAAIRVPASETYRVQEYHLPVYHWLCAALEDSLFNE